MMQALNGLHTYWPEAMSYEEYLRGWASTAAAVATMCMSVTINDAGECCVTLNWPEVMRISYLPHKQLSTNRRDAIHDVYNMP